MPQMTLSQLVQHIMREPNLYELREISPGRLVTVTKPKAIFDNRLEQLLIENCTFGSWLELQAVLTAHRAGVLTVLYQNRLIKPLPELQDQLVTRLYEDYGMRRDVAQWSVHQWAAALDATGKTTAESFPPPVLSALHHKYSYQTELVSDRDIPELDKLTGKNLDLSLPFLMPPVHLGKKAVSDKLWQAVFPHHQIINDVYENMVYCPDPVQVLLFCNLLSIKDGLQSCYTNRGTGSTLDVSANGWRLPDSQEQSFILHVWGKDDDGIRLARSAQISSID